MRGRALAGGCGIATAADFVLAAESAQFGYPEIKIGFVPAMVMAILRRSVSEKRALELLATGEIIPARNALEIGMINRVFADSAFDDEVHSYAAQMATRSSSALALTKSLFYQMDTVAFDAAVSAGVQTNALARLTRIAERDPAVSQEIQSRAMDLNDYTPQPDLHAPPHCPRDGTPIQLFWPGRKGYSGARGSRWDMWTGSPGRVTSSPATLPVSRWWWFAMQRDASRTE